MSISISEPANVSAIAEPCYRIAGGEAQFRARPFLTVMVCHVVPPCVLLEKPAKYWKQPSMCFSAAHQRRSGGGDKPGDHCRLLVQAVAETLAGLVFAQLVDPKVKAIFAPKPLVDLRTGR